MAIDVSASIATNLGLTGTTAAYNLRAQTAVTPTTRAPSLETPSALQLSLDPRRNIRINVTQARQAVQTAITAGTSIRASLDTLNQIFSTAVSGQANSNTDLIDGSGTRISRLNLTSQAGRITDAIDRLVGKSSVGGANLISSADARITLQTTAFGGRVTIRAQPLDSAGLGLSGLSANSHLESVASQTKVQAAINIAVNRLEQLRGLQRTLQYQGATPQSAVQFQNSALFETSVRGGLVNLTA